MSPWLKIIQIRRPFLSWPAGNFPLAHGAFIQEGGKSRYDVRSEAKSQNHVPIQDLITNSISPTSIGQSTYKQAKVELEAM